MTDVTIVEIPPDPELISLKALRCIRETEILFYEKGLDPRMWFSGSPACHFIECSQPSLDAAVDLKDSRKRKRVTVLVNRAEDPSCYTKRYPPHLVKHLRLNILPCANRELSITTSAGISVTRRGTNESFFVFRFTQRRDHPIHDLEVAARSTATLIVRDGLKHLRVITHIVERARSFEEPVALIQYRAGANPIVIAGKASDIHTECVRLTPDCETVIVVGKVISETAAAKNIMNFPTMLNVMR